MDNDIEVRLAVLETQMERVVSDQESEKATRARVNIDIMAQLREIASDQRKTDKIIWSGIGGLAVLQFAVAILFKK